MRTSKFEKLRDFAQGDFAIRDGHLFYKEKEVAKEGKIILSSSEEALFLFEITDDEVGQEFKSVVFLNFWQSRFYKCKEVTLNGSRVKFVTSNDVSHAYRLTCYTSTNATKIVGDGDKNY